MLQEIEEVTKCVLFDDPKKVGSNVLKVLQSWENRLLETQVQ